MFNRDQLNREIAEALGYTVARNRGDCFSLFKPDGAEVRPLSWWNDPEKAWQDAPRWTDDLNRAVTLYPFGISVEFHARADGRYMIYIDEQWYINHWFNFDELALGLSMSYIPWMAATC